MKLAFFNDFTLGVITGDAIVDVSAVVKDIPRLGPQDVMRGLIENFDAYKGRLADAAKSGKAIPLKDVRLRPPLPKPTNIECMAVNYMEDGTLTEAAPSTSRRAPSSATTTPWCCPTCRPRFSKARRSSRW
jgi:hypothetical protein